MQSFSIALAAAMLIGVGGTAPSAASPGSFAGYHDQTGLEQIGHRGQRHRDDDDRDWDDDDDRDRSRHRHRHHHRSRCHTEWVLVFTAYGPDWFPVRVCHRRRGHW